MGEPIDGHRKYELVAKAAVSLVRSLGSQAKVGAAVFPGPQVDDAHQCLPGGEVFRTVPGDPIRGGECGNDGPVTRAFSNSISVPLTAPLRGGTPTAATLAALLPTLVAIPGRTVVLLATDGGPNCNPKADCDATKCIPNIEGAPECPATVNCCSAASLYGPTQCLDDDATVRAIESLFSRGIKTYVVGIPGSAPYASLLNALAVAGGTARTGMAASYYDVEHISELDDVLASIGATVTLSCRVELAAPPPDSHLVNVYLDGQPVKYGPNGWIWVDGDAGAVDAAPIDANDPPDSASSTDTSDSSGDSSDEAVSSVDGAAELDGSAPTSGAPHTQIELVGTACDMLTSGKYRRLQVVFGCPTDIPR